MDCRHNGDGPRIIPGRHTGELGSCPIGCGGCLPCSRSHCHLCGVRHHATICPRCLAAIRADLSAIPPLVRQLPAQAVNGSHRGRLDASRPIPGGDATVLLAPGSDGRARAWAAERGDDTSHRLDESPVDPTPPLLILGVMEDDWRKVLGHPPATGRATIASTTGYLNRALTLAAKHHPAFPECAYDIRTLRYRMEDVVNAGDRDDPAGIDCFDCGGQLVRRMTDSGMADRWTCRKCRREYTDPEYHLAVRAKIEGVSA